MPWIGAAIGAGTSLLGGAIGANAADDARRAQQGASQQALNMQRQAYLASLGLQEPWRQVGQGSLNQLAQLFGIPYQQYQPASQVASGVLNAGGGAMLSAKAIAAQLRSGKTVDDIIKIGFLGGNIGQKQLNRLAAAGASPEDIQRLQTQMQSPSQQAAGGPQTVTPAGPDMSVFQASPDYGFRRDEGMRGIERGAAARGGAFSGNALRALTDFNSNLASGEFGDFVNRRLALAGVGQTATNQGQSAGQNFSSQGANSLQNIGNARASGIANKANIWGNALGGVGQALGGWLGQNSYQSPYQLYGPNLGGNIPYDVQIGNLRPWSVPTVPPIG